MYIHRNDDFEATGSIVTEVRKDRAIVRVRGERHLERNPAAQSRSTPVGGTTFPTIAPPTGGIKAKAEMRLNLHQTPATTPPFHLTPHLLSLP
jgi:hypothetical protein